MATGTRQHNPLSDAEQARLAFLRSILPADLLPDQRREMDELAARELNPEGNQQP